MKNTPSVITKKTTSESGHNIRVAAKRPRWMYVAGTFVLLCFLLGFTPGGEAMWTLGFWILSWVITILVLSRFGIKGFLKVVLIGLVAFLLLGIFLI